MFWKTGLVIVHVGCLLSSGYSAFSGNLEIPITHSDIDVVAHVTVGTARDGEQPQKLRVLFDTGSYNVWVVNKENCFSFTGSTPFYSDRSSSFTDVKSSFSGQYGKATITGSLGSDRIQIGEGDQAIVLNGQNFGLAKEIPELAYGIMFDKNDAVIGMDLVSNEDAANLPQPFLETLHLTYQKAPTIGFYINSKRPELSKITFGGDDNGLIDGTLNTHDVVKVGGRYNGWNVNVAKFSLKMKDGGNHDTPLPQGKYARIVSRKNPVIIGPADVIAPLNEAIFKSANFKYEKDYSFKLEDGQKIEDLLNSLPDVSITIDNVEYVFRPDQYIKQIEDKYKSGLYSGPDDSITLGLGFMFHYYTKFDYEKKQVHIGRAASGSGTSA